MDLPRVIEEHHAPPHYLQSMEALRAEFRARGWESPNTPRIVAEFFVKLALTFGGVWLFLASEHPLALLAGASLVAFGSIGIATNCHTASHGAAFRHRGLDMLFTLIGFPVLLGLSATYWIHKHIHLHHQAPNVAGSDGDIDLAPVFAILEPQVRSAQGFARHWYSLQWLTIIPALAFNGANMTLEGIRFVIKGLRNPRKRAAHWIDAACLGLHLGFWLLLIGVGVAPMTVLLLWVLRAVLLGYGMFAVFAPAHFPLEATCLVDRPKSQDEYVLAVVSSTLNFRTGWLGAMLCSGVQYQIEHHLFPRISHIHYREMAPLMKAYCEHHHYPYRTIGWGEGILKSLRVFREPKPLVYLHTLAR